MRTNIKLAQTLAELLGFTRQESGEYVKDDLHLKISLHSVQVFKDPKQLIFNKTVPMDQFLLLGDDDSLLGCFLKYYSYSEKHGTQTYKDGFKDGLVQAKEFATIAMEKHINSWQS
jgi:hypothetical protein